MYELRRRGSSKMENKDNDLKKQYDSKYFQELSKDS